MAIRNIRVLGDEILRKKAKEITEVTPVSYTHLTLPTIA